MRTWHNITFLVFKRDEMMKVTGTSRSVRRWQGQRCAASLNRSVSELARRFRQVSGYLLGFAGPPSYAKIVSKTESLSRTFQSAYTISPVLHAATTLVPLSCQSVRQKTHQCTSTFGVSDRRSLAPCPSLVGKISPVLRFLPDISPCIPRSRIPTPRSQRSQVWKASLRLLSTFETSSSHHSS